jgi:hypothetical protein
VDDFDGHGNTVGVVHPNETNYLVFRTADVATADPQASNNFTILPDITVSIDSETGSARITSEAEVQENPDDDNNGFGPGYIWPDIWHNVRNTEGSTVVDVIDPDQFNDPDGNAVGNINTWLHDVVGIPGFLSATMNSDNPCGGSNDDGWSMIDFTCIEPGYFHIIINSSPEEDGIFPNFDRDVSELGGTAMKFYCVGDAESADVSVSKTSVESSPASGNQSWSLITVTVEDQSGDRIDGIDVSAHTNNCTLKNTGSSSYSGDAATSSDSTISPAAGGTTVETWTDSDTTSDKNFLLDNPLEHAAGTAEFVLDCSHGATGTATIDIIVERPGSDIYLTEEVTIVGPTSVTGLTLTLTPDDLECGETILATANAVDSLGQAVSNGTLVFFTTDTSSGIVGGLPAGGAQGGIQTTSGEASVLIATDPSNPGVHTVIAYATKGNGGDIIAQTSATYTCDAAVAPAAPTVAPPATGTGTGSITPPNTGDAGLAAGSTSNASLFVIVGAVAFVLAGLASVRFARN